MSADPPPPQRNPERALEKKSTVLKVGWDREDGVLIASPEGRVDASNNSVFGEVLESGIPPGERALLLDMRDLSYMSSMGLSVLLRLVRKFRGQGRVIGMCRLSWTTAAVVSLSGFNRIIPVYETRAAALAAMGGRSESGAAEAPPDSSAEEPVPEGKRPRRFSFKMHPN